ncbi:helix-turn-helix transcriptional regulator [Streptomyces sp. NPDC002688]|uniref:helix-turn-helix domain-containing protein n=1 Tax=Streptomyces sp. NPDC002688 TaxID=3154423 RepID=UPI00332EA5BB
MTAKSSEFGKGRGTMDVEAQGVGRGLHVTLSDPDLQRRRLREQLRRLRESKRLTQRAVAEQLDWSPSKIIRIESGTTSISITDLRALLQLYGLEDATTVETLSSMARAAKERPWWDRYRVSAPPAFLVAIAYESAASVIRNFEPNVVPNLLQTEEYAREVLRWTSSPENVEAQAELWIERQERLLQPAGPAMHFVVDEAVLTRTVGGPAVMQRQLARLKELADHPNIRLRVVPFQLGLHRHFATPYVIYEFADPDDDLALYVESQAPHHGGGLFKEGGDYSDEGSARRYLESFYELELEAPSALPLIDANLERMTSRVYASAVHEYSARDNILAAPGCQAFLTLLDEDLCVGSPVPVTVELVAESGHPWARPNARPSLDVVSVPLSSAEVVPAVALYGPGPADCAQFHITATEAGTHRIRFTFVDRASGVALQQVEVDVEIAGPELRLRNEPPRGGF